MFALLGSSGYIGQAFSRELRRRNLPFDPLSRSRLNYADFETFLNYLRRVRPAFVINAAGYTGKPNVDACETARADTLQGNTLLPATLAHACAEAGIPWGHVSSGCIYSGAKVTSGGVEQIEPDLTKPDLRLACLNGVPLEQKGIVQPNGLTKVVFRGFTESDPPNFTFRSPPCSFYSGAKALGEEAIEGIGKVYIWRLRIPFDEFDNERNYLSKVQRYSRVYDNVNSISHRTDYVRACLDMWEQRLPFGIYNVTNPGAITTRQVVEAIRRILKPDRSFDFWENDQEFYALAAKTRRSNCILDVSKLLGCGIKIRPVEDALEDSLNRWVPEV